MKKTLLCFVSLWMASAAGFAETFVLENLTSHPMKASESKMAIQWAHSAQEVHQENQTVMQGKSLNSNSFFLLSQTGKIKVDIPAKVQYFRVVAWTQGKDIPDLVTNWIEIEPNKTYKLEADHLVPSVLMAGSGC